MTVCGLPVLQVNAAGLMEDAAADAQGHLIVVVTPSPSTTTLTPFNNVAVSNSPITVKGSAGSLYGLHLDNQNNAVSTFIQLFNKLAPTVGVDIPFETYRIPPNGWYDFSWGLPGMGFSTALTIAATTTAMGGSAPGSAVTVTMEYL